MKREDRTFFWIIASFFLASFVIRVILSGGLELDESEQLLLTQTWRWGYGPQPPLYVWLQSLFFNLFGVSILSLALFKNLLLFVTFSFIYLIARETSGNRGLARMAVLSLFLSPQYGWEFNRTLTHTVLATAAAAALLVCILDLEKKRTAFKYTLMGLVAGFGLLGKYNFVLLLAALLIAGLSLPGWRGIILDRRILLSLAATTVMGAGHLLWILKNQATAVSFTGKLEISQDPGLLVYGHGIVNLIIASIGLFWPLLIVYIFFLRPSGSTRQTVRGGGNIQSLLGRTMVITLGICIVIVFTTHLTRFNDRWLAPLLFFLPVYLITRYRSRITGPRSTAFVSLAATVMILLLALFPARVLLASRTGKALRLNYPYGALSSGLRASGFTGGNILAQNHRVGGNLRLHFPGSSINVPGRPHVPLREREPLLIAWNATDEDSAPPSLLEYVRDMTGGLSAEGNPGFVEAPMLHLKGRTMKLGYYIIEEPNDQSPRIKEE